MFPLWDVAIGPILRAAGARRIVEIGALRGETTVRMLDDLGPDTELHVVDPVPDFDPEDHMRRFPGRYRFHRAPSLAVLPDIGAMDAALIDGDHNWYTVYSELRLLASAARDAGAPLPVLMLHDVLWPYGRRDLYYAPERIPDEYRQPYERKGMQPGNKRLLAKGGLNPTMCNAIEEGGPRNGVMTALEDFVAEHDRALRVVTVPIYFGLAIVVEVTRLECTPALASVLDYLESADGRGELLDVAEQVRLRAMVFQKDVFFDRSEQLARARGRHLRVLKGALLNEHYLDHEVRLAHLARHVVDRSPIVAAELRDPARHDQESFRKLLHARTGPAGPDPIGATSFLPYTAMGRPQLDHLERTLDGLVASGVTGDLVECGPGRGGGSIFARGYLECQEIEDRDVWVAGRFRAAGPRETEPTLTRAGVAGFRADLNLVRDGFVRFDLLDDRVHFLQGPLAATLSASGPDRIALLRIGRDATGEVRDVLDAVYDRITPGGVVIVDAGPEGCSQVDAFRADRRIAAAIEMIDASAFCWRRVGDEPPALMRPKATLATAAHPPLAPPAPTDAIDLSVVVVVYNMRREAARTLHSLSRRYQQDVADIDYEVIVVENGSDDDQRLGEDFVRRFGPEFRYLDLTDGAHPSPVVALNTGIRAGRGRTFALMIDGAHVLTPGVLHHGMTGLAAYSPAVVLTQQWYVGPGQQGEAMDNGYDPAYEDRLFERIGWPHNGYRLFEISHFVGDRDWLDGLWESNCFFVDRKLLEQVGCFDESFTVAGGGYANLELYERLGSAPDVNVTTLIGEGSFHQVHGGTTTNQPDAAERRTRVFRFGRDYAELRGRPFEGPGKPIHYVGSISTGAARRSKPRRLSTTVFADLAPTGVLDGRPTTSVPVPDELKWAFTEAVWRNVAWARASWLGHAIDSPPTDLLAYQEIIARVRPHWVIETGSGDGARALFLASMCELVGAGNVVSIDAHADVNRPSHPRLRYVTGDPADDVVADDIQASVGDSGAVVILGGRRDRAATYREFCAYAPLVHVGSFVVVTDTIVNGHPVWTAFGPGPAEAVKQILKRHGDFVPEPAMEKYSLTFNPNGFLRRVAP